METTDGVDIAWFELEVKKKRPIIERLTIAGALIAAEIDRIQRKKKATAKRKAQP